MVSTPLSSMLSSGWRLMSRQEPTLAVFKPLDRKFQDPTSPPPWAAKTIGSPALRACACAQDVTSLQRKQTPERKEHRPQKETGNHPEEEEEEDRRRPAKKTFKGTFEDAERHSSSELLDSPQRSSTSTPPKSFFSWLLYLRLPWRPRSQGSGPMHAAFSALCMCASNFVFFCTNNVVQLQNDLPVSHTCVSIFQNGCHSSAK